MHSVNQDVIALGCDDILYFSIYLYNYIEPNPESFALCLRYQHPDSIILLRSLIMIAIYITAIVALRYVCHMLFPPTY